MCRMMNWKPKIESKLPNKNHYWTVQTECSEVTSSGEHREHVVSSCCSFSTIAYWGVGLQSGEGHGGVRRLVFTYHSDTLSSLTRKPSVITGTNPLLAFCFKSRPLSASGKVEYYFQFKKNWRAQWWKQTTGQKKKGPISNMYCRPISLV